MAETYCGKTCADCPERTRLNCPGCKNGPGRPYTGECGITKCCVSRGHRSCEECTTASTCSQWKRRTAIPSERLQRMNADTADQIKRAKEHEYLAQWLWTLFWLRIISIAVNAVFALIGALTGMKLIEKLVSAAFSIGHALILLKLASSSYCFRSAGICGIICTAFSLTGVFLEGTFFAVLFTFVALIPSFVSLYQEFMGYSEITEEEDEELSSQWRFIWFINLGALIALAVSLIMTVFGSVFGALLTIVVTVANLVVEIYKMVFLYKTAKLFGST